MRLQSPISPALASRIIMQIGGCLAHAHNYGVIHRDIKPSNNHIDRSDNSYLQHAMTFRGGFFGKLTQAAQAWTRVACRLQALRPVAERISWFLTRSLHWRAQGPASKLLSLTAATNTPWERPRNDSRPDEPGSGAACSMLMHVSYRCNKEG